MIHPGLGNKCLPYVEGLLSTFNYFFVTLCEVKNLGQVGVEDYVFATEFVRIP